MTITTGQTHKQKTRLVTKGKSLSSQKDSELKSYKCLVSEVNV